jgi:hypothetical protein
MSDTPQTLLGGSDTPASAATTQHAHHHPHLHGHSGKRLRQFFSPEGRRIHVAHSPDEANKIRKQSLAVNEKDDFDLVIHGSPEHVSLNDEPSCARLMQIMTLKTDQIRSKLSATRTHTIQTTTKSSKKNMANLPMNLNASSASSTASLMNCT